jgi:hypothetical protein
MLGVRARRQVDVGRSLPLIRDLKGLVFDADTDASDPIAQVRRGALARAAPWAHVRNRGGQGGDTVVPAVHYWGALPARAVVVRARRHAGRKARVGLRPYGALARPVLKVASGARRERRVDVCRETATVCWWSGFGRLLLSRVLAEFDVWQRRHLASCDPISRASPTHRTRPATLPCVQAKQKKLIDLPVPSISAVADYASFTPADYVLPLGYVKRQPAREGDPLDNPRIVEYDLEYEDEVRARGRRRTGAGRRGCARQPSSRACSWCLAHAPR